MTHSLNNLFKAQFMGVFNDNLLKNLICFISIYWAPTENKALIISAASITMVMPYIFLSPLAGSLAQKYSNARIFQLAKLFEIPIMLLAFLGFINNNVFIVLITMLLMGIQSSLYSPAKYGLIKEISNGEELSKHIGKMEMLSFCGVLGAGTMAGFIADLNNYQLSLIGFLLIGLSLLGWKYSLSLNFKSYNYETQERQLNPLKYFKTNFSLAQKIGGINLAVVGLGSFWFIGSLLQMTLVVHCPEILGMSFSATGLVSAIAALGIGLGCWASGYSMRKRLEVGTIFFAGIGMSVTSYALLFTNNEYVFTLLIFIIAFCGGLFKIPLNSWIQERTPTKYLSNMLAYSNMLVFLFILLSAGMFSLLKSYFDTYFIFKFIALTAFFVAIASISIIPVYVLRFCVLCLSKIVFNVNINGQVNLPVNKGAILALNHVSLLDALVVVSTFPRNVRFVVHQKVFDKPILGWVLRNLNMIPVNPGLGEKGLKDFTNRCIKTLNEGHVVCIFPEGQLSRNGKLGKFKKGIEFIADRTNAPIIPIHMEGLHGTPLSYKTGTDTCYKFSLKKLRSKVSVLVGSPIEGNFSVEYLYSVMKELEVNNINHLYANCFPVEAIKTIYNRLFQEEVKINNDYRIQPFIVPTPNYKISTLSRKNVELVGTKPSTLGQPIPGVAIRLVNDEGLKISNDKVGFIQIKHAFCKNPKWAFSGYKGSIDADGFVTIISK